LEICGNGDGEVHNGVTEFFDFVISIRDMCTMVLPVLLLLNLVPGGECILAKVGEVGWNIILHNNYLHLLAMEIFQGG
jgi:hypothetical protein